MLFVATTLVCIGPMSINLLLASPRSPCRRFEIRGSFRAIRSDEIDAMDGLEKVALPERNLN